MILGIGIDVCEVARIERALDARGGARFRARVFTAGEAAYCERRGRTAGQSYAATFAAKEAALKALGTGWSEGLTWHDVEVLHEASGAPRLALHGEARALARRRRLTRAHLTLSHAGAVAVAVVVLEGGAAARGAASRPRARPRTR